MIYETYIGSWEFMLKQVQQNQYIVCPILYLKLI